ncbi:MAG TPA: DEAD/DEAH box helicase [Candidatus Aphodovivens avistercoris]|nr:DEAD/DEAH box helicase [Candidatus Aphodovivens avistercoris]
MGTFERYAPFIQDFIYEHDWENLRAIQVAAADALFNTDDNVLLCASTASGKTEAAFFPILTEFWEDPPRSVGALYIGPLKALINDQFSRLTDLCAQADIPVWHWHGDVAASRKARLMKNPSGILQITPESLEALLLRKHSAIARLFGDLRYIVIDEVHSLLRGDRGGQTLCLIERLGRLANVNPRRIGLSATIGDPQLTGAYLAAGSGRGTVIPRIEAPKRPWRLSMEHFYVSGPQAADDFYPGRSRGGGLVLKQSCSHESATGAFGSCGTARETPAPRTADAAAACGPAKGSAPLGMEIQPGGSVGWEAEAPTDTAPAAADPGLGYIFEHTKGKKCLVFVNSREEAEGVCTSLRQYCEAKGEPDRFLIHHGNLSSSFRESAEDLMKDDDSLLTTVTTATLELGIDIGRLERAFQIDAPFTVSSFLQRMGRTGRRGAPQEMWFVMREEQPEARAQVAESIPWKLLQGIALVQLYVEDRWVEPPRLDRLPYSLLLHQTLATLASEGEMSPAALASRVLPLAPFHRVTQDDFRLLLLHLLETDLIERTEGGGLIVGLAGERVVNSFKFYAVFQENEEYTVRSDSQEIGTIVQPPPAGEKIAIAGHVWVVDEVDHKRHLVYCTQVKGKVPAYFGDCPGDINTRVLERMCQALKEDASYPYLMRNAVARLALARHVAENAGLAEQPLVNLGGDAWCLLPWLGSYSFLALERMLKRLVAPKLGLKGIEASRPYFIQFKMPDTAEELLAELGRLADRHEAGLLDPMELLYPDEIPLFEKYDALLPPELVRRGFAYGVLDVEGACARIRSWDAPRPLPR